MAAIKMNIETLLLIPSAGARKIKSRGNPQPMIIQKVCLSNFIAIIIKLSFAIYIFFPVAM